MFQSIGPATEKDRRPLKVVPRYCRLTLSGGSQYNEQVGEYGVTSEVRHSWPEVVNSAMHEEKALEFNPLANWQSMKTERHWCDVISSVGSSNESCRRILDHLQLIQQSHAYSRALPWSTRDETKA